MHFFKNTLANTVKTAIRGTTLIELLVTLAIFGAVTTVVVGSFITLFSIREQASVSQNAYDDVRLVLDVIEREIQSAKSISCTGTCDDISIEVLSADGASSRWVKYRTRDVGGGKKVLVKGIQSSSGLCSASNFNNNSCFFPVTNEKVNISLLGFEVKHSAAAGEQASPIVSVGIIGSVSDSAGNTTPLNFSTSITPRNKILVGQANELGDPGGPILSVETIIPVGLCGVGTAPGPSGSLSDPVGSGLYLPPAMGSKYYTNCSEIDLEVLVQDSPAGLSYIQYSSSNGGFNRVTKGGETTNVYKTFNDIPALVAGETITITIKVGDRLGNSTVTYVTLERESGGASLACWFLTCGVGVSGCDDPDVGYYSITEHDATPSAVLKCQSEGYNDICNQSPFSRWRIVNTGSGEATNCPVPPPQCSNGSDDDGDGLTDFPNDPGCSSALDNDETNVPTCWDRVIYGELPGDPNYQFCDFGEYATLPRCDTLAPAPVNGVACSGAVPKCCSTSATKPGNWGFQCIDNVTCGGSAECNDGIDNADPEDILTDYPSDPGCSSALDNNETDVAVPPPLPTPRLIVCPSPAAVNVGTTVNLDARYWADFASVPDCTATGYSTVTGSSVWSTSNASQATVGAGTGVVTGVAAGTPTITATYSGLNASRSVTVNAAGATGIWKKQSERINFSSCAAPLDPTSPTWVDQSCSPVGSTRTFSINQAGYCSQFTYKCTNQVIQCVAYTGLCDDVGNSLTEPVDLGDDYWASFQNPCPAPRPFRIMIIGSGEWAPSSCSMTNAAPTANAGINRSITLPTANSGASNASASDSDGAVASTIWSFVGGPGPVPIITNGNTLNPTFSGMNVIGIYTFNLQVTDNQGAMSNDAMLVTVNPAPVTNPRLIICPSPAAVNVGSTVSLRARYWADLAVVPACSTAGYSTVTNVSIWSSNNILQATVGPNTGVVTGVAAGTPTITATYLGLSASRSVTVSTVASSIRAGCFGDTPVWDTISPNVCSTVDYCIAVASPWQRKIVYSVGNIVNSAVGGDSYVFTTPSDWSVVWSGGVCTEGNSTNWCTLNLRGPVTMTATIIHLPTGTSYVRNITGDDAALFPVAPSVCP